MTPQKASMLDARHLWSARSRTLTAPRDLAVVLGSVVNLPMKYWQPNFFFFGAPDHRLSQLSSGAFPAVTVPGKSHPVFTLRSLPDGVGFTVCPCSSKGPFDVEKYRFIRKGCHLGHSRYEMDRNSYLVEKIRINMPPDTGGRLRFKGEVPEKCIEVRTTRF